MDHIEMLNPDVILLQEIRVLPEQLPKSERDPEGWHVIWHPAERKGYAGTAVWSRTPLSEEERGVGAGRFRRSGFAGEHSGDSIG